MSPTLETLAKQGKSQGFSESYLCRGLGGQILIADLAFHFRKQKAHRPRWLFDPATQFWARSGDTFTVKSGSFYCHALAFGKGRT